MTTDYRSELQQSPNYNEDSIEDLSGSHAKARPVEKKFQILITSFGYKAGSPPPANMLFDVRFLQNPYWVEELRPLTGLDKPVQDYVLSQPLAQEFLTSCIGLLELVLPHMEAREMPDFTVAFGCTGGQHRSTSVALAAAEKLRDLFPDYMIRICHRELDAKSLMPEDSSVPPGK